MTNPLKILVVEDDQNLSLVYRSLLEEAGYQIQISSNGTEALEMVKRLLPDLLITDAILPGMDGFELTEALRENPATRRMPIIFISGVVDAADRKRAAGLGVTRYLSKPVQVTELLSNVKTALNNGHNTLKQ